MKTVLRIASCLAIVAVWAGSATSPATADSSKPNIVIILSDDYGYGSAGCYGAAPGLIRTPNLDRLAREGRRFTDASTPSSVCTPTRYALLTGRYCWRTRLNHGGVANTMDPLLIETSRPTIASLLGKHGYATAMVGKWHLGYGTESRVDYTKELKPGPLELGFDYQFAVPQNHNDITRVFVENHKVFGLRSDKLTPSPGKLGLDAPERDDPKTMEQLTDRAVAWLEKQQGQSAPFFLYFAPVAVHELVTPSARTSGTSPAGPYGDFIHDLDLSVGRILGALENIEAVENTLVIFTSDNGGVVAERSKSNTQKQAMDAGLKINGALRGGKHDVWDGGFRVPFIARWPDRIPAGSTSDQMIGVVDIFATVAAAVGETHLDRTTTAPDSVNVLSTFIGTPDQPVRTDLLFQSANGVYAIRSGPWKWIEGVPLARPGRKPPGNQGPRANQFKPQLYNLQNDLGETEDVSARHPDVVKRLSKTLSLQRAQGSMDACTVNARGRPTGARFCRPPAAAAEFHVQIRQLTHGPSHHFFGYIGHVQNIPWSGDCRYIVALRTSFQDRMPNPAEPADVVLIDTQNGNRIEKVDESRAWNSQQGTMFYWNPAAASRELIFNDRDPETHKIFTVVYDVVARKRVREYRFDDTPLGNSGVAQCGGYFLGVNYGRLARLRPVTGYPGAFDWNSAEAAPANDGVFLVDMATGEKRLLVSFADLARTMDTKGRDLFINHTLWSRDDSRIYFYVRGEFGNRDRRIDIPVSVSPDGARLTAHRQIGGHPEWLDGTRLIGSAGNKMVVYDVDAKKIVETLGGSETFPKVGGDVALSPDSKWLVVGDRKDVENFYVILRRADRARVQTRGFPHPGYTSGDLRVDGSPCWNRTSDAFLFPAIATDGTRQLFVARIVGGE